MDVLTLVSEETGDDTTYAEKLASTDYVHKQYFNQAIQLLEEERKINFRTKLRLCEVEEQLLLAKERIAQLEKQVSDTKQERRRAEASTSDAERTMRSLRDEQATLREAKRKNEELLKSSRAEIDRLLAKLDKQKRAHEQELQQLRVAMEQQRFVAKLK